MFYTLNIYNMATVQNHPHKQSHGRLLQLQHRLSFNCLLLSSWFFLAVSSSSYVKKWPVLSLLIHLELIQMGILHQYSVEKMSYCLQGDDPNKHGSNTMPSWYPDVLSPFQSSLNHTPLWAIEHGSNYLWPCTQHKLTKTSFMRQGPVDVTPTTQSSTLNSMTHMYTDTSLCLWCW